MENYRELIEEKLDNVILQHSYSRNREKRVGSEYVEFVDWLVEELDRAMGEGYEEGERSKSIEISGYFSQTEGEHLLEKGKEYVIISREEYDKLSKLAIK